MGWSQARASPSRDLLLFICGPALAMIAMAVWFAAAPWPVPTPNQAQLLAPAPLATTLLVGALGVWLSSRVGLPSAPASGDGGRWARLILSSAGLGLLFAASSAIMDRTMGLGRVSAQVIGQPTMNVAFPASVPHYLYGSFFVESFWRIGLIPILTWVIGKLVFRDAAKPAVLWTIAIMMSLIEPVAQSAMIFGARPDLALIVGSVEAIGNIAVVALYTKFGWPAPVLVRIAIELGWHVAWPLLSA